MAVGYVVISNTGNISGGLRLAVKAFTWRIWTEEHDIAVDLAGQKTLYLGAQTGKSVIEFTAMMTNAVDGTNAPLGGEGSEGTQTTFEWANPPTAAKASLKVRDIDGRVRDMLWKSKWVRDGKQNESKGASEHYEMAVRLETQ